jgi:hypothetical protein
MIEYTGGIIGGLQIIEDPYMFDVVEDWSGVRSRSRAERRRRQGHKQRVKLREVPKPYGFRYQNKLVMHPEMARAVRAEIDRRNRDE